MLKVSHKKCYFIGVKFSNFQILRNLYFDFFFNIQSWNSQLGRDSCLKIVNKDYVIFGNSEIEHLWNSFSYEILLNISPRFFFSTCRQQSLGALDFLIKFLCKLRRRQNFQSYFRPIFTKWPENYKYSSVKLGHSEKATKIWNNLPLDLTFTELSSNQVGECFKFCGLFKKPKLYSCAKKSNGFFSDWK